MLYHLLKETQSFLDLNGLRWRKWFALFKSRGTSLEDKPGRGRPSDFDDQALFAAVEVDESLTNRMLADNFHTDLSATVRRLKKLEELLKLIVTTFRIKRFKYLYFMFCIINSLQGRLIIMPQPIICS
uniref:Mos1 transposase HTH domain-containing protein n=1 Tax=Glossina pallidipes TaxID=7398 RepID=A0A1A9ZMR1_GLOPL